MKVDEVWCEGRCSDKVNAYSIQILLKIILTDIISIQCYSDHYFWSGIDTSPT